MAWKQKYKYLKLTCVTVLSYIPPQLIALIKLQETIATTLMMHTKQPIKLSNVINQ